MSDFNFSQQDIEAQFMNFMRANGCEPEGDFTLQIDGQLHRFSVQGDRHGEKTGAYCVYSDGWPAGWCQNWRNGEAISWSYPKDGLEKQYPDYFSSPEFQQSLERSKQRQAQFKAEQEQKQRDAIKNAGELIAALPKFDDDQDHAYADKKNIWAYNLKIDKQSKRLAVPIQDINGNIVNIQWIYEDGTKRFLPDAPLSGNFYLIDPGHYLDKIDDPNFKDNPDIKNLIIFIGEGVATMHTFFELTGQPCIAAMNCGNIKKVAEAIKTRYPNKPIIIAADNDHKKTPNAGKEAAEEACRELKLDGVVMPDFADDEDGTDWNDFFALKDYDWFTCTPIIREKIEQLPRFDKRLKYKRMAENCPTLNAEFFSSFITPLPGKDSLIEDWIPTENLIMLFAPSGTGKGFVAVDIAYSIANPNIEEWHGKKVLQHGPVVYLAGEGQKGLRKRFAGIAHYKNVPYEDTQLAVISEAVLINDPNQNTGINCVIANIGKLYPNPALVILDTTNRYMFGDENKTVDATTFINAATKIITEFHCTVMIIHHTGVNKETQGRARGSSVFHANIDMEFSLSKVPDNSKFIQLNMTKSKDTENQKPITFEMLQIPVPGFFNDAGYQETTCVIEHNEAAAKEAATKKSKEKRMSTIEKFARDTYRKTAISFGKIIKHPELAQSVVAVKADDWNEVMKQQSVASTEVSQRQQCSRARKCLVNDKGIMLKYILNNQELYCLMPLGEDYDTEIMQEVMKRNEE